MKTLYDLLGALPDDDADDLRAAFRKAAKANHPDNNPGNPEASQRFRRIVRANAILSDGKQRAAYDRLLEVARRQQSQKPARKTFSGTIRRLAADAIASAAVSVVLIGGYLLYQSAGRPPLAPVQVSQASSREPAQTPAVKPTEISDAHGRAEEEHKPEAVRADVNPLDVKEPTKLAGIAPAVTTGTAPAVTTGTAPASAAASAARDFGTNDARYYRERGSLAYRSGDMYFALVNFDLAIHLDPGLPDSYIDRAIVFHRLGELKRAFSDVAEAKRIDDLNRSKTASPASAP